MACSRVRTAGQTQFDEPALLQGAPETFDAALGLGGARSDVLDTQGGEDAAELGKVGPFPGQLVFEGDLVAGGREEHGMQVGVDGPGQAIGLS